MRDRRPRLNASLYVGLQRYFLTFCTHDRQRHFESSTVVEMVLGQIVTVAPDFSMAVVAYCFMPDHVHLLIEGKQENADMRAFVHRTKQKSGYLFAQTTEKRLWQPSYYDRVLRDDDATISVVRYIVENPMRAGLVETPADYPFLGSGQFSMTEILEAACWQP